MLTPVIIDAKNKLPTDLIEKTGCHNISEIKAGEDPWKKVPEKTAREMWTPFPNYYVNMGHIYNKRVWAGGAGDNVYGERLPAGMFTDGAEDPKFALEELGTLLNCWMPQLTSDENLNNKKKSCVQHERSYVCMVKDVQFGEAASTTKQNLNKVTLGITFTKVLSAELGRPKWKVCDLFMAPAPYNKPLKLKK